MWERERGEYKNSKDTVNKESVTVWHLPMDYFKNVSNHFYLYGFKFNFKFLAHVFILYIIFAELLLAFPGIADLSAVLCLCMNCICMTLRNPPPGKEKKKKSQLHLYF